jgi:hypothetical protein
MRWLLIVVSSVIKYSKLNGFVVGSLLFARGQVHACLEILMGALS